MDGNFGINIKGTGSYLPKCLVDNNMMAQQVDTNDEWITTRTGIKQRCLVNGETTWYMGTMAAKAAIESANVSVDDIGMIIDCTVSSDFFTPSTACIIQRELQAKNAIAFDVNAACTGFIYAVDIAKRFLQTDDKLKYILIVANEMLSRLTDFNDRSTCILFGDGAGAVVIERAENAMYGSMLGADGNLSVALYAKAPANAHPFKGGEKVQSAIETMESDFTGKDSVIVQLGKDVYKFATNALPEAARKAAADARVKIEDIDVFIPHQANVRIIETAAKNLGVSMDKFILNLQNVGNTSSASIPIALDKYVKEGRIKRGDVCCLVGFGAGATLGAVVLKY